MELRYLRAGAVELRERAGRLPTIRGTAIIYNSLSSEISHGGKTFRELVRPGAFSVSIASGAEILARFQHGEIIGRTSDRSLRLMPNATGIKYQVDPYESADGRNAVAEIRRGKVRGSSFAMIVSDDTWRHERGWTIREIISARLIEVSPVSSPAYRDTEAGLLSESGESLTAMQMRLRLAEAA